MARYIDADKLEKDGWMLVRTYSINPQNMCYESKSIDEIPTADVRENVRGEWIQRGLRGQYHCSNCKHEILTNVFFDNNDVKRLWKFCPNCGADMRQRSKNE